MAQTHNNQGVLSRRWLKGTLNRSVYYPRQHEVGYSTTLLQVDIMTMTEP
jgi:hypothetical protein